MTGITKGPWSVERQGPSCATIWAGDQCVFDAIDVAGNEANLTAIGEVPAMVAALRDFLQAWPYMETDFTTQAHAILSRIDGATPTDEPAAPTGEETARPRTQWALTIIRKNWEPRFSVYPTEEDVRQDLLEYAREVLELEVSDLAEIAELADRIGEDGRDQVYWGPAGPC